MSTDTLAFSPYRAVGNVCGTTPFSLTTLHEQPILMLAIGRSFHLYRGASLALMRSGPTFQRKIRAVAHYSKWRYVAEGGNIHAFSMTKPIWTHQHSELGSKVTKLLAVDDLLFSIGEDKRIVVWSRKGERLNEITVAENHTPTAIVVPFGYKNKILIGTKEGHVHLYNFVAPTKTLLVSASLNAPVYSVATGTFHDVVALGLGGGRVVLFNFATNETLFEFKHEAETAVTAVAFRHDRDGFVASGTARGEVAIWDLENRCLDGVLTRTKQVRSREDCKDPIHSAAVLSLEFLPSSPFLISAGEDNALLEFRFDTVDCLGVVVRERRGHFGECTSSLFYNEHLMVTSGTDRALRVTHLFSDRASWELSQGKLGQIAKQKNTSQADLRLTTATHLDSCPVRENHWASLVSIHADSTRTVGWRMDTRSQTYRVEALKSGVHSASCIGMSRCGNFVYVGYTSGHFFQVNLQSSTTTQFLKREATAHAAQVNAAHVTAMNTTVVTCSADKTLRIWSTEKHSLLASTVTPFTLHSAALHRDASLLAVVCGDHGIRMYSVDHHAAERPPVREFIGHSNPITALAFTPDTHAYIVSASVDAMVMIWNVAAGVCVGQYAVPAPVTSLCFQPDALFMLTTHVGERGAFLWTNNLRYGFAPDAVEVATDVAKLPEMHFPQSKREADTSGDADGAAGEAGEQPDAELFDAAQDIGLQKRAREEETQRRLDAVSCDGIKLSGMSLAQVLSIPNLDQIKERNKPLVPPKKINLPFFLPQSKALRPTFIVKDPSAAADKPEDQFKPVSGSEFVTLVCSGQHEEALAFLKSKSVSECDLEIRRFIDLPMDVVLTEEERTIAETRAARLISFFLFHLRRRHNFDLVQALLATFVSAHADAVQEFASVRPLVADLVAYQSEVRRDAQKLSEFSTCLVTNFTDSFS